MRHLLMLTFLGMVVVLLTADHGGDPAVPLQTAPVSCGAPISSQLFSASSLSTSGPSSWTQQLRRLTADWGIWAPLIFLGVYVVGTILMVPGSPFTLAAGMSFGLIWGTILSVLASMITITVCFLLAREFARHRVEQRIEGHPVASALDRAVAEEGWQIVALTRLSALLPFNLQSYAYGLSAIPLGRYLLASWICMLPSTILLVYIGARGEHMLTASLPWTERLVEIGALVALGAVLVHLAYLTRKVLRKAYALAPSKAHPASVEE